MWLLPVAALVAVAACGGDDTDDAGPAPTTEAPGTSAPRDTDDAAGDTTDSVEVSETTDPGADPVETTGSTATGTDVDADLDATMRFGWITPPDQLDPHKVACEGCMQGYVFPIYDRLLQSAYDGSLQPMLATDWTVTDDQLAIELTLREGVTFHDGTPFDANVVKANIERAKSMEAEAARQLRQVNAATVVDDYTVRLDLATPAAIATLQGLAGMGGTMISPAAFDNADLFENPAGSGAYELVQLSPGDRVVVERSADPYWDPDAAKLARIELIGINDNNARINSFRAGELDMIWLPSYQVAEAREIAESDPDNFALTVSESTQRNTFLLNPTLAPFDDPRVRQAAVMSIDRELINETILADAGSVLYQPFGSGMGYNEDLDGRFGYDPVAAKELLAEAGYPDGLSVDQPIYVMGTEPHISVATAVQAMLSEIGISVTLETIPTAEIYARYGEGTAAGAIMSGGAYADPATFVDLAYLNPLRVIGGPDPAMVDLATEAANLSLSDDERDAKYQEFGEMVVDDAIANDLISVPGVFLSRTNVHNVETMPWLWRTAWDTRYLVMD